MSAFGAPWERANCHRFGLAVDPDEANRWKFNLIGTAGGEFAVDQKFATTVKSSITTATPATPKPPAAPTPVAAAPAKLSPAKQTQLNAMLAEIAADDARKAEAAARAKAEAARLAELKNTARNMYGKRTTTTATKAAPTPAPAPANDASSMEEIRAAARAAKAAAIAGYVPATRWARS